MATTLQRLVFGVGWGLLLLECKSEVEVDPKICRRHDGDEMGCLPVSKCLYVYSAAHPEVPDCLPRCWDSECPDGYTCGVRSSIADGNFADNVCSPSDVGQGPGGES